MGAIVDGRLSPHGRMGGLLFVPWTYGEHRLQPAFLWTWQERAPTHVFQLRRLGEPHHWSPPPNDLANYWVPFAFGLDISVSLGQFQMAGHGHGHVRFEPDASGVE